MSKRSRIALLVAVAAVLGALCGLAGLFFAMRKHCDVACVSRQLETRSRSSLRVHLVCEGDSALARRKVCAKALEALENLETVPEHIRVSVRDAELVSERVVLDNSQGLVIDATDPWRALQDLELLSGRESLRLILRPESCGAIAPLLRALGFPDQRSQRRRYPHGYGQSWRELLPERKDLPVARRTLLARRGVAQREVTLDETPTAADAARCLEAYSDWPLEYAIYVFDARGALLSARPAPIGMVEIRMPCERITTIVNICCRSSRGAMRAAEETLLSLRLDPTLALARVIIAADGVAPDPSRHLDPKCAGPCDARMYAKAKEMLLQRAKEALPRVELLEMPFRACLSSTLKHAMRDVKTEFVNVVQDDLPLQRSPDVALLMETIEDETDVDLVRYTDSNASHYDWTLVGHAWEPWTCASPPTRRRETRNCRSGARLSLSNQYSDQNHVATVDFYEKHVWPNVKEGSFMEHDILCMPSPLFPERCAWFLGDYDEGGYIHHLDGRNL